MRKILLLSAITITVSGVLLWLLPTSATPVLAAVASKSATELPHDSTFLSTTGLVGAGGSTPLLARTAGQVLDVFFTGGEYVRRGQLLAKLTNHTFVTAPRAGFLGSCEIITGQYITTTTLVTVLSRYSYLVVAVQVPASWRSSIHPRDSVRVWAVARPDRLVSGIVGPMEQPGSSNFPVEILLTSRAPLRIGERATVRLHGKRRPLAAR